MGVVDDILRREGPQFTNRPNDRGGPTKYGITQSAWDSYVADHPNRAPCRLVEALTEPMAREFYEVVHIGPWASLNDAALRALMADCSVLHGRARATRWLQAAVGAPQDAIMGPVTYVLANQVPLAYPTVLAYRIKFLAKIATDQGPNDPDAGNLVGWINRACEFLR